MFLSMETYGKMNIPFCGGGAAVPSPSSSGSCCAETAGFSPRGEERERGESSLGNVRTFYNYMTCVGRLENFEPDLD